MTYNTYIGRYILAVVLLSSIPFLSIAQVAVQATSHTVVPDEEFTVDIRGIDFNDILGCQFSVEWDESAFTFVEVTNIHEVFEDAPLNPFGTASVDTGHLAFQYADFSLNGISLGDTATLFSIKLKTIEDNSGEYIVNFTDTPTAVEVSNTNEEVLDVEFFEGTITIDGISDLLEQNASKYVQITSNPNPFRDNTTVNIKWKRATADAQINIYDPAGKAIFTMQQSFQRGEHKLDLPEGLFAQPGIYLLKVQSADLMTTYKLIAI